MTVFYDARQIPFRFALLERAAEHHRLSDTAAGAETCAWHFEQAKLARDLAAVMGDAMPLDKLSRWPQ